MTSSSLSQLDFRVESFKFGAGLVVGESPVDTFLAFVAIGGPGGAAAGDFGGGVDAVGEALSGQNAQLGFGHVEPTTVAAILELAPTMAELEVAAAWLNGQGETLTRRHQPHGKASEILSLIPRPDDEYERQGP